MKTAPTGRSFAAYSVDKRHKFNHGGEASRGYLSGFFYQ